MNVIRHDYEGMQGDFSLLAEELQRLEHQFRSALFNQNRFLVLYVDGHKEGETRSEPVSWNSLDVAS